MKGRFGYVFITGEYGRLVAVESAGMGLASWALHRSVSLQELPLPDSCESATGAL